MKNLMFLFLSFFILLNSATGQVEFAPPGATWSFTYQTFWTSFNGYMVLHYEKDTTINGFNCKKLHGAILDLSLVQVDQRDYFTRQSADSVFWMYPGLNDDGFFLFKTQYQANEVAMFGFLWNEPLSVSTIETITSGSQSAKKYVLDSDGWLFDETYIYDRFGPDRGFFQSWWGVEVDGESFRLLCYRDDSFPPVEAGNGPCIGLTAANEPHPARHEIKISPNPASDKITFDFPENSTDAFRLTVFDATGRAVMEQPRFHSNLLDVSNLAKGVYFGNLMFGDSVLPFRFVKQ